MLKTPWKIAALSAVSLTLLSACGAASKVADLAGNAANDLNRLAGGNGNGGNGGNGGNNAPTPTAAVADRVVSFRLVGPYNNAGTYVADGPRAQTNESEFDDSYNLTITETQDTFALVQSGDNLVMTVNGTAYTFTPGTPDAVRVLGLGEGETPPPPSYGWDAVGRGNLIDLSSSDNDAEYIDLRDVLDGTHPEIQGTYIYYNTSQDLSDTATRNFNLDYTFGYATIGIQTLPSVVASQTATATYVGNGSLNPTQGTQVKLAGVAAPSIGNDGLYMDINFNVNFGTNTVSGTGTDVTTNFSAERNPDGSYQETINGIITFGSAPIVGNGFAGTFTIDSGGRNRFGISGNPIGNYAGNFFGPAADDIAGVMRIQGTNALGTIYGGGGFRADRDVDPAQ